MIKLDRTSIHDRSLSHDMFLLEHDGVKIKMTYSAGNAYERMNVEFFNNNKWNSILNIYDLGETPNTGIFVCDPHTRKLRANFLFETAKKKCKLILS